MWGYVIACVGLGLLCGGWVVLQRLVPRDDAAATGKPGGCASCSCRGGECTKDGDATG